MDNRVYHSIGYGMYIIGVLDEQDRPTGCVVNTVFQITAEPPVFAVSLHKQNKSCELILKKGLFTASSLSTKCDPATIGLYGYHSAREMDKSESGKMVLSKNNLPYLKEGACAYLELALCATHDLDTHIVFFGRLINGELLSGDTPMTYSYYQTELKGKSPALAPTFLAEKKETQASAANKKKKETASAGNKTYVCTICNYVYDGDIPFEELPDDWTCPICGVPKSMFEVI